MSHAAFEMDEQLKEIALRVASEMPCLMNHVSIADGVNWTASELLEFAARFLAALPKPEPVGVCDTENRIRWGGNDSSHRYSSAPNWLRVGTHIYTEAPLIQPAQGWNPNWPVMGYGRVSIGGGLQPNGLQCLLYMDMGETREIDADTTDLFPVGSYADPQKTLAAIYFKDGAAIQQTIDVLRDMQVEIGYAPATPPAALALARADLEATVKEQAAEIERLSERRCEICGYAEHHREHTGCLRQQLAAAQLHIEQLRGAMLMMLCDSEGKCFMAGSVKDRFIIDTVLSTQPDRSALEADRQRVAEACAKVCDAHNDFYRNGIVCGEKIRAGQWKDHMK